MQSQREEILDHAIIEKTTELKRALDSWTTEIHTASDPLSPIISDKGVWILQSPVINSKSILNAALNVFREHLTQISDNHYELTKATFENKLLKVTISDAERVLLTWSLFNAELEIPIYDEILLLEAELNKVKVAVAELNKEMTEISAIVKSPNALVANGYYNLYLMSFFRKGKFKREVAEIWADFTKELNQLKTQLKSLEEQIQSLMESSEPERVLNLLNRNYQKFPRILTLTHYKKHKDIIGKDNQHL